MQARDRLLTSPYQSKDSQIIMATTIDKFFVKVLYVKIGGEVKSSGT